MYDTTPLIRLTCTGCHGDHAYPLDQYPNATVMVHHRHLGAIPQAQCAELIITGHDNLPGVRSQSIDEEDLELFVDAYAEIGEDLWEHFISWVHTGEYIMQEPTTVPDAHAFLDRYQGVWDSPAHFYTSLDHEEAVTALVEQTYLTVPLREGDEYVVVFSRD